ncbi:MAG: hypothetical protein MJE77_04425 [Proteobacteria bacterium]|nr:hypothetical protein [Pseudomonadota bacterium]
MSGIDSIKQEVEKELLALGDGIKEGLWNEQNKNFLRFIAGDIAALTHKILNTTDEEKKKRYTRSIELLNNHVAVMAFSRLNIVDQEVRGVVERLLDKCVSLVTENVMAKLGAS